jgi:hypothetical protein
VQYAHHIELIALLGVSPLAFAASFFTVAIFRISLCEMRHQKKRVVFALPIGAHTTSNSLVKINTEFVITNGIERSAERLAEYKRLCKFKLEKIFCRRPKRDQ